MQTVPARPQSSTYHPTCLEASRQGLGPPSSSDLQRADSLHAVHAVPLISYPDISFQGTPSAGHASESNRTALNV
jgi:hypothetical protein